MKKYLVTLILTINFIFNIFSGCISSGPDVQILSVQINPLKKIVQHPNITEPLEIPYYNYFVTLFLKNIGNEDAKARIDLDLKYWNEDNNEWQIKYKHNSDSETIDLNASEYYNLTLNATRYKMSDDEEIQFKIQAYILQDDEWIITDDYEKVFDF